MKRTKQTTPTKQLTTSQVENLFGAAIGASGTTIYKGFYNVYDDLEYVEELKSLKAIETYNRLRRSDGQVQLALLALENPILNADWLMRPPGDAEQDDQPSSKESEATKKINEMIFGDEFEFADTLRSTLGMFWAGHSVFEKCMSVIDGLVHIKLEVRLQNTIREWRFDEGKIGALRQVIYSGETKRDVWIPGDKIVCFTFRKEGDDPRGISALRPAYKHWFHKDFFYRIQAMQIERWGLGIPKIMEDQTLTTAGRKSSLIEAVENMRAHEKGYVYVPKGYDVAMLDAGSGKMIDPLPAIQHHDAAILKTIMAQFLELGQTETGARSLGETLKNAYLLSLQSVAQYVADKLNREVISPLCKLNFGDTVRPPYLAVTGIQPLDMQLLADAYQKLGASGLVKPGPKAEAHIREQLGIPDEDEIEEIDEKPPVPPVTPNSPDDLDIPSADDEQNDGKKITDKGGAGTKSEANKQKCSCGAVHNAAPPPMVERGQEAPMDFYFWRDLRPHEKFVSLRSMVGRLDDAREEIVRATREARKGVIAELMIQVTDAIKFNDPKRAQKIDYSDVVAEKMETEVMRVLWEMIYYGHGEVYKEVERQAKKKKLAFPNLDETIQIETAIAEWVEAQGLQMTEVSLDKLVDHARAATQTAMRTGGFDPAVFKEEMGKFSENVTRRSGGYVVNEAMSLGRDAAAKELMNKIKYAEYSAILDMNTCENCAEIDARQEKYQIGSADYERLTPPLYNCEGGAQCRCIWIFVGEEESVE